MLTVDFARLGLRAGERLLDMGAGAGRHAYEALRRGAHVIAFDLDWQELHGAAEVLTAMHEERPTTPFPSPVQGNALALPFPDNCFDRIIASEVLEHIPDDRTAMQELMRVLRPGGTIAVTVPRWYPEKVCWALSDEYHSNEGGHVRIYTVAELESRLRSSGLQPLGRHHAHALHSAYWWVKCAAGVNNEQALPVRLYRRFLEWEITTQPQWLRTAERLVNPVLGKSVVVYLRKPGAAGAGAGAGAGSAGAGAKAAGAGAKSKKARTPAKKKPASAGKAE